MLISTILLDEFLKSNFWRYIQFYIFYWHTISEEKKAITEKEADIDLVNIKSKVESQV